MCDKAESLEGELNRRVSGVEAEFRKERATMQEVLQGERLASKEKLQQVKILNTFSCQFFLSSRKCRTVRL